MNFSEILRTYWGYDSFRGIQRDIIESVASGRDTLGLMPTGGGKSITFQVPAMACEGLCLVITPLIALMKDQVANLRKRGIMAAALHSGYTRADQQRFLDNAVYGGYKFLYVSPERLSSDFFLAKIRHAKVSFITVDEAHCISQWGYDFRPSYLQIAEFRKFFPEAPVLALTATATPRVVADIQERLTFREDAQVFRMSFERPNLAYVVRRAEDKMAEMLHILRSVSGSAVVYMRSRQGTLDTAKFLRAEGISALYYHAGLTDLDKDVRQRSWQDGATRVMVATNAFGMGIDKPDVRLVIHLDTPDSLEAYFQEAGRAGRDGGRAYAVLLWNGADRTKLLRRPDENFPSHEMVARVYDALAYSYEIPLGEGKGLTREFDIETFCRTFRFFPVVVESALRLLTLAGYLCYREADDSYSRAMFLVERDDLYRLPLLPPGANELIQAMLRQYTGLFSQYVRIEEDRMAALCETTPREVYELLKMLTHLRVLHYIPRRRVPRITYAERRILGSGLVLPAEVYEDRRTRLERQISAVLGYAESGDKCRSRMLLEYFGQDDAGDCGCCDVCLAEGRVRHGAFGRKTVDDVCARILSLFSDGRPRRPDGLRPAGCSDVCFREALGRLVADGSLVLRDGFYVLSGKE